MYKILSTEKTKAKGSEFETKAMLYLMNFRDDSKKIHFFVIDFFNDLTGIDKQSKIAWDLQSKAYKNNYPSDIGAELVTLYKNYCSDLLFHNYILFIGGVVDSIRIDSTKNIFTYSNITEESLEKIKKSLIKTCNEKSYINSSDIIDSKIDLFLKEVLFVIDDKSKIDYIKEVINLNPRQFKSDILLEKIFNEIRDVQSSKKNNNNVEGIEIEKLQDFFYFNRHLTSDEIKMLVLNRVMNYNIMDKGIPTPFLEIHAKLPKETRKITMEDCKLDIARTLFTKNNSENIWKLFSNIYQIFNTNSEVTIENAYELLDHSLLEKIDTLNFMSTKYFMAIIKDGLYEN